MDIERLKELKLAVGVVFQHWLYTAAYIKGFDNTDSKKFYKKNAECIQALIDEAIARQSVTEMAVCPNCNGSGVYQEYDENDRYHLYTCVTCYGSGEVDRQQESED